MNRRLGLLACLVLVSAAQSASGTTATSRLRPVESAWVGLWHDLVAERSGSVWAQGANATLVYDPSDRTVRELGPRSRSVFTRATPLSAAAAGGVWLDDATSLTIVRVHDDEIVQWLGVPSDVCAINDEEQLAIATCDGTVAAWDGTRWAPLAGPVRDGVVRQLDAGSDGSMWLLGDHLWELADGSWVRHDDAPAPMSPNIAAIATGPDGTLWIAGDGGFARYDGGIWSLITDPGWTRDRMTGLAIADDGVVWVVARRSNGSASLDLAIRWDGRSSRTFDLPAVDGTDIQEGDEPSIVVSPGGVFASGSGSLTMLLGDQFQIVDTSAGAWPHLQQVQSIAVDGAGWPMVLVGTSSTSGTQDLGIGQVFEGGYAAAVRGIRAADLQEGPLGTVWVATSEGPARVAIGEDWDADAGRLAGPELSLPFRLATSTQTLILPPYAIDPAGAPYTVVEDRVVHLDAGRWLELPPHPGAENGTEEVAIAPDGAIWVVTGSDAGTLGLARFRDPDWDVVSLPEARSGEVVGVTGLAFDRAGSAWLRVAIDDGTDGRVRLAVAHSTDGTWVLEDHLGGAPLGLVAVDDTGMPLPIDGDVVIGRDGAVWVNGTDGIARFIDGRWDWPVEGVPGLDHLTVGGDGSIWAAGIGAHRLQAGLGPTEADPFGVIDGGEAR